MRGLDLDMRLVTKARSIHANMLTTAHSKKESLCQKEESAEQSEGLPERLAATEFVRGDIVKETVHGGPFDAIFW